MWLVATVLDSAGIDSIILYNQIEYRFFHSHLIFVFCIPTKASDFHVDFSRGLILDMLLHLYFAFNFQHIQTHIIAFFLR